MKTQLEKPKVLVAEFRNSMHKLLFLAAIGKSNSSKVADLSQTNAQLLAVPNEKPFIKALQSRKESLIISRFNPLD